MGKFLQKLIITTLSLGAASYLVEGIIISDLMTLIIASSYST